MEEIAYQQYKNKITESKIYLENACKRTEIKCGKITEDNIEDKFNIYFKKLQKRSRKYIDYPDGIVISLLFSKNFFTFVINDKNTFIYNFNEDGRKGKKIENDIEYDYEDLYHSYGNIYRYNQNIKYMGKVIKVEKINITKIKKISQFLKYENLDLIQYESLEKYFDNHKFPNQLSNDIITNFVHSLIPKNLEILLRSGGKFINPHYNTYNSERGIYTTLKTNECETGKWGLHIDLIFSKQLANDLGYIFNFHFQYGILDKKSIIKGEKFEKNGKTYSAIEYATLKLCKKKDRPHEVVFFADHIKLKDYLEAIVFTDEKQYQKFKNMKGIKFKNKMKLIKEF